MKKRILNLGAGVQSTALYLMAMDGEIEPFDVAIFADTQEEPADVYQHLAWLESLGGPPIVKATAGKLGDCLLAGSDSRGNVRRDGSHFSSIPAYVIDGDKKKGLGQRQCTKEFKVDVVERVIRRQIFGVEPGRPLPKDSLLFDLEMSRGDCVAYLKDRVPHKVPRSACVFCPYKTNKEWLELKETDPVSWARAVQIDEGVRGDGSRGLNFLHRSYQPLAVVDLRSEEEKSGQRSLFSNFNDECEGMCGV